MIEIIFLIYSFIIKSLRVFRNGAFVSWSRDCLRGRRQQYSISSTLLCLVLLCLLLARYFCHFFAALICFEEIQKINFSSCYMSEANIGQNITIIQTYIICGNTKIFTKNVILKNQLVEKTGFYTNNSPIQILQLTVSVTRNKIKNVQKYFVK